MRETTDAERFTLFWGGPFSQWEDSPFISEGVRYTCAEQYMMSEKALFFGDLEAMAEIMLTRSPARQKAIGRRVRRFDADRWAAASREVVYRGSHAKFTQNPQLLAALLATAGTTIVEASPEDPIWGIGLAEDDPRAKQRSAWRGTNWLGEVLTRLRDNLVAGVHSNPYGPR